VGQAPADVKGHIPQGVELPPARAGEHALERRRRVAAYLQLLPGWLYLFIGFVIPLIIIVYTSLTTSGLFSTGGNATFSWHWANYADAFSLYSNIYIRSLIYAGIATTVCIGLAYPMAYWIAFYGGRWKSTLFFMILVPFFVSFVIRTIQWKFILGDHGPILGPLKDIGLLPQGFRVLATPFAVVAGITYNFLPFTALPLYVALERIDKRLVEAAKDLYATRWEAFRKVIWPLSLPGVFAAFLLTFVPATGDYVNATLLGGPGTTMIGNIIQEKFLVELDYPEAAALSVILMVVMLVLATVYARILGTEDVQRVAGAA
jgi:spermidine/putrescine transport system permease protein